MSNNELVKTNKADLFRPNNSSPKRRRLFQVVACVISGAVAVLLAEAICRLGVPQWQPRYAERAVFWRYDKELGWAQRPGQSGRFVGPEFDVSVNINSHGLRDVERAGVGSSPNGQRLLLLGDSFGWGFGVEQTETVAALLSEAHPDWDIINASVSGYSTDQQYLWYRKRGRLFAPDVVLLLIHPNDIPGNATSYHYGYQKPQFVIHNDQLKLTNAPVPERTAIERVTGWLRARTYLGYGLHMTIKKIRAEDAPNPKHRDSGTSAAQRVTHRILTEFAAELNADNARFVWAPIPAQSTLADWLRLVADECRADVVDLSSAFATASAQGRSFFLSEHDPHWNADGHRITAHAIDAFLTDYGIWQHRRGEQRDDSH